MESITMHNRYKGFFTVISIIIVLTLITGCGQKYKYVVDARGSNGNSVSEKNVNNGTTLPIGNTLDPFDGLSVSFDGVSPFCTVSFNNSKCSEDVQLQVQYSLSPDKITTEGYFGINEDVTVYAILRNNGNKEEKYTLSESQKTYTVKNVPHYLTEINENTDLTQFKSELKDYLESITAFKVGECDYRWYNNFHGFKAKENPIQSSSYFSILKKSSYDKYPKETDFVNKIDITFSMNIMADNDETWQKRYFTIYAKNIIQYPDGTIGWGKDDPKDLNFEHNIDWNNMESLVNSNIISNKSNYNVDDISEFMVQ